MPYNAYETPGFEITYAISGVCSVYAVLTILAVDILFFSLCLHIQTVFEEFSDRITSSSLKLNERVRKYKFSFTFP